MRRYFCGMITGIVVGATIGMMVVPQLDRKTQKNVRRFGQKVMDLAEESYDGIKSMRY